jgi:lipoprotein-anchoring transpeptidase ErfK/SrfK
LKKVILIVAGVVVVVGLIVGGQFIKSKKVARPDQIGPATADELIYKKALTLTNEGSQDEALTYWKRLAGEFPKSRYADRALFNMGEIYFKKGEFLKAEGAYERIIQDYPNGDFVKKAQQSLGRTKIKILFSPVKTANSQIYEVEPGDNLSSIAKKFNTTVELIMKSNQLTDDFIRQGKRLKISTAKFSLVVDKSLNALTLKSDEELVKMYRVSTGNPNNPTPVGTFFIVTKLVNPVWRTLPAGNPENILGSRWMGFKEPYREYGIHGTTEPESIGKNITNGCIRMLNQDVEELYAILPLGTEVTIIE